MTHRLYYALAALCVFTVAVSLLLSQELMVIYRSSVLFNHEWADRVVRYQALARSVSRANAPGNDVFDSKDPDQEEQRLDGYVEAFDAQYQEVAADLDRIPEETARTLRGELALVRGEFRMSVRAARGVFSELRRGRADRAAEHMAEMDRRSATALEGIDRLNRGVSEVQAAHFDREVAQAEAVRGKSRMLVLLGLVVVAAVIAYGRRLSLELERQRRQIGDRHAAMQRLLANVGQGLVTVDLEGRLSDERSTRLADLLGHLPSGASLWDCLADGDDLRRDFVRLCWESVLEDVLPLEVALAQLPARIERGGRAISLEYRPIQEEGALTGVLLVATDVTDHVARERAEAEQREIVALFERIIRDREGVIDFFIETQEFFALLQGAKLTRAELARVLHTLKGNASLFGLSGLTEHCHQLEDELAERGEPSAEGTRRLLVEWQRITNTLHHLIGEHRSHRLELEPSDYSALLEAILGGRPRSELVQMVSDWVLEPSKRRLERLGEQARGVAGRLGKPGLEIRIEAHGVRTSRDRWGPFWSALVHVIRNAVDHGIETPEARRAAGKPPGGRLELTTRERDDLVLVEVADDGRGVDWEALARRAHKLGLPAATESDLLEALFTDGVSTRERITELSGRGVGMAAVRAVCRTLGGQVEVESRPGLGTRFRFSIPREVRLVPFASTADVFRGTGPAALPLRSNVADQSRST